MEQALCVRNLSSSFAHLPELMVKKRAINIVKYQNFQTKIALQKMDCDMPGVIFSAGVAYIKYGTRNKTLGNNLVHYIDEAIAQHVQPLTPTQDEKRMFTPTRRNKKKLEESYKKDAEVPIAKLEILQQPITEKFEYGVMLDKNIRMFDSEEEAIKFVENIKIFCSKGVKVVEVKINEIDR